MAYFHDSIEIQSLGLLIPGLRKRISRAAFSRLRNLVISRVSLELGQIEQWGSGDSVTQEEAANEHLPQLLFEQVGLLFRVTLPLPKPIAPAQGQSRLREAEPLAEKVHQALAQGPLSNSDIAHALGRDSVSGMLNRSIRQLLDRKDIGYALPNSRLEKQRRLREPEP